VHAATLFRPFRLQPVTLGLFLALLATMLLAGCGNSSSGTINVVAGNAAVGFGGDGAAAINAELNVPAGVAVDTSGNFYIADSRNNVIREVTVATGIITTVAGSQEQQQGYSGDNGPAIGALLNEPVGVAVDTAGNLYIADMGNNAIRKVTINVPTSTGPQNIITTVAGISNVGTAGYSGDGGPAISATLSSPAGVAVDSSGNVYVADLGNNAIREVKAGTGIISTAAGISGVGTAGYAGDSGPATSATLNGPRGVAVDTSGNIYIADSGNNAIREVTASTAKITTIVGNGTPSDTGDNGAATSGTLNNPTGLTVDSAGNLYIADSGNNVVRKVTAPPSSGIITTAAGNIERGNTGNGGPANEATLNGPSGVAVNSAGSIYIADEGNDVIREVTF